MLLDLLAHLHGGHQVAVAQFVLQLGHRSVHGQSRQTYGLHPIPGPTQHTGSHLAHETDQQAVQGGIVVLRLA